MDRPFDLSSTFVHAGSFERHPAGDELLLLLEGALALVIEEPDEPDRERRIELATREACVVPRGLWHRLEMRRPSRLLFVAHRQGMESHSVRERRNRNREDGA